MFTSETLLNIAIHNLNVAKVLYEFVNEDELFLNTTTYHLQQAAELALKHCIEMSGIRYPKTHSIVELLGLIPENIEINKVELLMMPGITNEWESRTRYIKGFRLVEEQVEIGFNVVGDLLNCIKLYCANGRDYGCILW